MVKNNGSNEKPVYPGRVLLLAAFFVSGAASLIFEVIWTRILLISIGATAIAVGAVLGAFMAGMAIGSFLAGRDFCSRLNPVITYACLEGWIGIYSLITPYLLRLTAAASPVVQFGAAVLIFLPATIAMGASLPILSRALAGKTQWKGVEVGRLYAVNTAGAFAGPLIAVFFLFPACGLNRALYIAAAANLLVFAGIMSGRKIFPRCEKPETIKAGRIIPPPDRTGTLLLLAVAVSGAAAMVYEVAWARTLSIVYGSSIYGVSIMLSTFLLGIASGSALAAVFLRRRAKTVTLTAPVWLLAGAAVGAFFSLLIARILPFLFINLYNSFPHHDLTLFISQFILSLLLMLPATLCLGAMLPVAAHVSTSISRSEFGRQVSRLYTANLLGSTAGPLVAAGLLIGNFGIELSVRAAAILTLLVALILTVAKGKPRFPAVRTAVLSGAVLFILVVDPGGEPVAKGFGFYNDPKAYSEYDTGRMRQLVAVHQLLYYRDGPTATVCVQQIDRYLLLKINGKTDASNGSGDTNTQLLLGHLPLMAADAKKVAIIGMGSGMTAGAVLTHDVEKVDVFEIEPAVVEASHSFDELNGKPLNDPRLRLILGDARSQLLRRDEPYDLIISEPSNPWITGVANLFTKDFFELAALRLKKDGILSQWFHLYGMSLESTRSLIATFRSVFPHTLIFKDRDLILIGSRSPFRFDMHRMQRLFDVPRIRENLALTFVRYPFDLLVQLRLDGKGAADFSQGAILNSDDNLLLELAAPKSLYHEEIAAIRSDMARYSPAVIDHVTGYGSAAEVYLELSASLFTSGRKEEAHQACLQALEIEDSFQGRKLLGQILQSLGRIREAREALIKALSLGGDTQGRLFVEALLRSMNSPGKEEK